MKAMTKTLHVTLLYDNYFLSSNLKYWLIFRLGRFEIQIRIIKKKKIIAPTWILIKSDKVVGEMKLWKPWQRHNVQLN